MSKERQFDSANYIDLSKYDGPGRIIRNDNGNITKVERDAYQEREADRDYRKYLIAKGKLTPSASA